LQLKGHLVSRCIEVGSTCQLEPGQRKLAFADGQTIVVFNIDGVMHAIENSCPHNGASLASGKLEGNILQCPAHGLRFDLATGHMAGAAGLCLKKLPVQVQGDKVVVVVESQGGGAA